MEPAQWVETYGYLAVAVGTFFEGEMIMLAAGVAASAGLLNLPLVIVAGMTGIFASDTTCFLAGRLAGQRLERWFPRLYPKLGGILRLIERHDEKMLVFFQFFPGLCTVTPLAFGLTRMPASRFLLLDFLGNATWTLVFTLAGYGGGAAVLSMLEAHPGLLALIVAATIAGVLLLWWGFRFLRHRLFSDALLKESGAPSP
jgi:membrane protein DedA with SNARE-associated domain